jgi:hypothetical protein
MNTETIVETEGREIALISKPALDLAILPARGRTLLLQMFTDPYLLQKEERVVLIKNLRECVAANLETSDLRVVLGMALCVNFEVEAAIDELEEGLRLAPNSFIANLKMGELWMRLRVMEKSERFTHQAALLANNPAQAEMARKQAATLRALKHEGLQRNVLPFKLPPFVVAFFRKLWKRDQAQDEALAVADIQ